MAIESPVAKQQFFDANGNPLVGGKLYIYEAGTTTPATTWTDKLQTAANANPIILDSRGECVIWLDTESAYKYVLKTATDVEVYSVDNVNGYLAIDNLRTDLAADAGSSLIGHIAEGTGAVTTDVQTKLRETISVKDFGAVGDGVTDDTAAIQAALDNIPTRGGKLLVPSGLYVVSSPLILPSRSETHLVPLYIFGESSYRSSDDVGSRLIYTGTTGSLLEGRGAAGTDERRGVILVRDIQLSGPGSTTDTVGINLYKPTGFTLENILVNGFGTGVDIDDFWYYSSIRNSLFRNSGTNFHADGTANGATFENCSFSGATDYNVSLENYGFQVNFENCTFEMAENDQVKLSQGRGAYFNNCYWEYGGSGYAVRWSRQDVLSVGVNTYIKISGGSVQTGSSDDAVFRIDNSSPSADVTFHIEGGSYAIKTTSGVTALVRNATGGALTRPTFTTDIQFNNLTGYKTVPYCTTMGSSVVVPVINTRGSFTPEYITNGTGFTNLVYSNTAGVYQRIGNLVHFELHMRNDDTSTLGSPTGSLFISGLPFAARANIVTLDVGIASTVSYSRRFATGKIPSRAEVLPGETKIRLYCETGAGLEPALLTPTDLIDSLSSSNQISISGSYIVD